jgi:hypothetical protein
MCTLTSQRRVPFIYNIFGDFCLYYEADCWNIHNSARNIMVNNLHFPVIYSLNDLLEGLIYFHTQYRLPHSNDCLQTYILKLPKKNNFFLNFNKI